VPDADGRQRNRGAAAQSVSSYAPAGDLILYGVVVIQPVAPMSSYGVLVHRGKGHVVTSLLIAMVACSSRR